MTRIAPGTWSIQEVIVHMVDSDLAAMQRRKLTLAEIAVMYIHHLDHHMDFIDGFHRWFSSMVFIDGKRKALGVSGVDADCCWHGYAEYLRGAPANEVLPSLHFSV